MWTLIYWLLTAMMFLFIGWGYSGSITRILTTRYIKPFILIVLSALLFMGVYGAYVGSQTMFLEFNRDRNDTMLTTCFEAPPVTRFEYKYNCGNNEECAILYYDCNSENSTIQQAGNNETGSLEITSISWEAQ